MYISNKHPKIDNINNAYLWHCWLDYINKNRIDRLTKEEILNINDCESLPTYESYLLEKVTKSPFIRKSERVNNILSLVHHDVCGSMNTSARDGYSYFITSARYEYIYLMKHKSESFEMFK